MITEGFMYWILKLDDIRNFLGCIQILSVVIATIFGVITLIMIGIARSECTDEEWVSAKSWFSRGVGKLSFIFAVVYLATAATNAFLPSTKQLAMIKVVPKIANNDTVEALSKDAKELYKLGVEAIKEQLTTTAVGRKEAGK